MSEDKKRSRGDDTRAALIQAGIEVFSQRGYHAASSRELTQAAGTNQALINYHFGSRGDLYQAVLAEAHRRLLSRSDLERIVARVTDWQDIGDEAGEPLAFSPERLRALLNCGTWVVKAVREAITTLDDDGRRKN